MRNEVLVLGAVPEYSLQRRIRFEGQGGGAYDGQTAEEYYSGTSGMTQDAEHIAVDKAFRESQERSDWLEQIERDRAEREMYREGYYGA